MKLKKFNINKKIYNFSLDRNETEKSLRSIKKL